MIQPVSAQESTEIPSEIAGLIPTLRTFPMPADANANGDIFGGWILSRMGWAGAARAHEHVGGRVVTVGIEAMTFHKPVFIGDEISMYTEVVRVGRTSITVKVDSWCRRRDARTYVKVTEGLLTFVAIGDDRQSVEIRK